MTEPSRRGEGTVILEPHPDDACYSIGAAMAWGSVFPPPVRLLTLFDHTDFLGSRGFQSDARISSAARRDESRSFCRRAAIEWEGLGFHEASLRHGRQRSQIFPRRPPPTEPGFGQFLRRLTHKLRADGCPALLVLPLGLGGHRDHALTHRLGRAAAAQLDLRTLFYEDLPYAAQMSLSSIEAKVRQMGPVYAASIVPLASMAAKVRLCGSYRSQFRWTTARAIARHAARSDEDQAIERLWTVDCASK